MRFFLCLFFTVGCSVYYQDIELKRATEALNTGDYNKAVYHYQRIIKKSPEQPYALKAAENAANVSLLKLKDFLKAINFFEFIVLYSKNELQRIEAQEQIAFIYYERLN
ncbi:MAG: hypothetical protein KDD58_06565, partial [Bdellovibrionales bacterium]|nr:hypothetical protein [Bdellovibrionales bacterium]